MIESITVCVCTYRRDSVEQAILSVANQSWRGDLRLIIVDNDLKDERRTHIEEYARRSGIGLTYVHAPAQNISIARNAALEAVGTRFMAFMDDDEVAATDWLKQLVACFDGSQAVIGPTVARYPEGAPAWLALCDFHSSRVAGDPANGHTGNVLLDVDFVRSHKIRFHLQLGQTGGEDTLFFRDMERAGAHISYCAEAIVFESVPLARAQMRWVLRRKFRAGQTHGFFLAAQDPDAFARLLATAGAKCLFSAIMSIICIPGTVRSRRWLARGVMHAGAISYRLRRTMLAEYKP